MSLIKNIKKLIVKEDKKLPYQEELHLSGLFVRNEIVAQNDVWVTKSVTGNIYCTRNIVVCKDVLVTGNIHCRQCILEGAVKGDVSAAEMIEIRPKAALNGNIITENLKVDPAAFLNGYVTTIMDGRRVDTEIKLKIEQIHQLGPDTRDVESKNDIEAKIERTDHIKNDNGRSNLRPEISIVETQAPKARSVQKETASNERWW